MWWRVASIAIAFGLIAVITVAPSSPGSVTSRPVVIASLPCDNPLQSTSSGFTIDDGLVVTVAHAVYESRDFAVRDASGTWHEATIRSLDLARDLAVLEVEGINASPMPMRVASRGSTVQMAAGAASGTAVGDVLRRVRISTEVIGDLSTVTERSGYELDIRIRGGDSGAGVVDGDGNLVGLMFARSTSREAAWATSITELQAVLDSRAAPEWECEFPSTAELILEPLIAPDEQTPTTVTEVVN